MSESCMREFCNNESSYDSNECYHDITTKAITPLTDGDQSDNDNAEIIKKQCWHIESAEFGRCDDYIPLPADAENAESMFHAASIIS